MYQKILAVIGISLSLCVFSLPEDQYQPIEIHADSAIRHEKEGVTTYNGNVLMRQGSLQVEADTITVSNSDNKSATNLLATGKPAKFQQQPEANKDIVYATANIINYQLDEGKIELAGQALLTQGEAKISSDKIVYLSDEQIFKAERTTDIEHTQPQRVQVIIPAKKKTPPKSAE
jgi:lipopolysaccharide export system protein LptA